MSTLDECVNIYYFSTLSCETLEKLTRFRRVLATEVAGQPAKCEQHHWPEFEGQFQARHDMKHEVNGQGRDLPPRSITLPSLRSNNYWRNLASLLACEMFPLTSLVYVKNVSNTQTGQFSAWPRMSKFNMAALALFFCCSCCSLHLKAPPTKHEAH